MAEALKHLFGKSHLKRLADAIVAVYPSLDRDAWMSLLKELESLEMKPRVRLVREELRRQLPVDYARALGILMKSARGGTLEGFDLWSYSDFIQTYGLQDVKLSLDALRELTGLFSSEFAVRPFLKHHPKLTLGYLTACANDPSVDVRRWASEGSRPRLPWGERLQGFVQDPEPTLRILEQLKFDPELYVRKSVSNHLNDIGKDHPERVIEVLAGWRKQAPAQHAAKIEWIIHRALRSLIKAGHPGALELIGAAREARIEFSGLKLSAKSFQLGDRIEFEFTIRSMCVKPQKLVVDYVIHFVKANQSTSPKVFKLKTWVLPGGEELAIKKSHPLKQITTRVHHPGTHFLEIQVNGQVMRRVKWELKE